MDRLPKVNEPEPVAPPEEIFEVPPPVHQNPGISEQPPPTPPPAESLPTKPAKRKYQRDPIEMKAHMAIMREKAAESRKKKKQEKEKVALTTDTVMLPVKQHAAASFELFMQHYAQAEGYKEQLAHSKRQAEEAAQHRISERRRNRKRVKKTPREHPFGIQVAKSPMDAYSSYFG